MGRSMKVFNVAKRRDGVVTFGTFASNNYLSYEWSRVKGEREDHNDKVYWKWGNDCEEEVAERSF